MRQRRNSKKRRSCAIRLGLSVLVILWSVQTAAGPNALSSSKKKAETKALSLEPDEVLLERGDRAPFFGILTPEKKFSIKEQDLAACEIIKEDYINCVPDVPEPASTLQSFLLGALTGGLLATLALGLRK